MVTRHRAYALGLALWMSLGAAACQESQDILPFFVVTPEGQDTFAGVAEVRVTFADHVATTALGSAGSSFSLDLTLDPGETGSLVLEGLSPSGQVLCRGKSPEFAASLSDGTLSLFVSRVGSFGRAPTAAPTAAVAQGMADYNIEDWNESGEDNLVATLWFGGDVDGTALDEGYYYDSYFHDTLALPELPVARSGVTALNIDSGNFMVVGGRDGAGEVTGRLDLLTAGTSSYEWLPDIPYGVTNAGRADARSVGLGPYPALTASSTVRVLNSFLVVGGQDGDGIARNDVLHLKALYDTDSYTLNAAGELLSLSAPRLGHTVSLTETTAGGDTVLVALIFGGANPTDAVAETILARPEQVDSETIDWRWGGGPVDTADSTLIMVTDHAAITLADGRVLIVGGRTADGTPVADGWLYEPDLDSFSIVRGLLATPRYGHTVARWGVELVVAGGTGPGGVVLGDAEIFDVDGGTPIWLDTTALAVPRTGHQAFPLPGGSLGITGGTDADGEPTAVIEIYTPGLVD